jgi:hypothetical protein
MKSPSQLIDARIKELGDWRGETLARLRALNSSLEGNTRRAIDVREREKINAKALQALIRAAVALNKSKAKA